MYFSLNADFSLISVNQSLTVGTSLYLFSAQENEFLITEIRGVFQPPVVDVVRFYLHHQCSKIFQPRYSAE